MEAVSKSPAAADLPPLLTNVAFEVEVLAWTVHCAAQLEEAAEIQRDYQSAIDRSAYVNAAWVATRNLLCFFANSRWQGSPIARDYVDWDSVPGGPALGVANDRVTHIGLRHLRTESATDLAAAAEHVDSSIGLFYGRLAPDLRSRFHASLAAALNAVITPGRTR